MPFLTKTALSLCIVWLIGLDATAQFQITEIEKPQLSKSVAGVVADPSGAVMPEVAVEEWSADWKKFIRATHTDSSGRFYFPPQVGRTIYHLQFRCTGFNFLRLKVKLDTNAKSKIMVKMVVAT